MMDRLLVVACYFVVHTYIIHCCCEIVNIKEYVCVCLYLLVACLICRLTAHRECGDFNDSSFLHLFHFALLIL